ncbi:glycosyltransferase [Halobaculum sp. WSA2]|uniref:Glycosyltransferase n=1 Tax=Halobaculum saliterrae TaxID=2073113 RepID=A0A6B0SZA1_9EURY|nr:glycosyltransferase [Halobaculum saliterrae]MXR41871.1 glycosyltransferase [Halobaculum saliterrae]
MEDGPAVGYDELDVALAHWHVNAWGGAEYLVTKMAETLGVDQIYTVGVPSPEGPNPYGDVSFYDVTVDLSFPSIRRFQSRIDRVFEYSLWEDVDWREYGHPDVLITSGATTRAVITPDDVLHINYCHSPPRWFYDLYHDRKDSLLGLLSRPLIRHLRTRDVTVDPRVDYYFANSPIIARRLRKYYDREAHILYPPVPLEKYRNEGDEGFYLHLGRLDNEKGVLAIVKAFEQSNEEIRFVGGRGDVDQSVVDQIEGSRNMYYEGFVSEERKLELLATCTAVVFNGRNEDFGIVPIEANASGKAVLTRNEGFQGVFVEEGVNGYLHDGSADGIVDAIHRHKRAPLTISKSRVEPFSLTTFDTRLHSLITEWHRNHQLGSDPAEEEV